MKIGILLICYNTEKEITNYKFRSLLTKKNAVQICFVNNASKDNTLEALKALQETAYMNVSVIDIKKYKSENVAIKAGARYLKNKEELQYILYLKLYTLSDFANLREVFYFIKNRKELVKNLLQEHHKKVLSNVFSLDKVLEKKVG